MSKSGNVLVAMSGGVDSTVAAILLLEQGYKVYGVTFRVWDYMSSGCKNKESGCCSMDAILEAKEMSGKLGISHEVMDLRKEFVNKVIRNFMDEYLAGRTPNPCVLCNSEIKWGFLLSRAIELGCDYIATGHYAKINQLSGRHVLSVAEDKSKDQTYVLWGLSQEQLKPTLFPIGKYKKKEIKEMALSAGFNKLYEKRESQEICFIPGDDYNEFLKTKYADLTDKLADGNILSLDGKVLGKHKGYPFYTIGQRKGLGIALGEPMYVVSIHPDSNEIVIGQEKDLERNKMIINHVNSVKYQEIPENVEMLVRIRYRGKGIQGKIKMLDENMAEVNFNESAKSITPGQSAVLYEGDDLLGGGIIMDA